MAWLSGITGKAENFLNSLDQRAASVLEAEKSQQNVSAGGNMTGSVTQSEPQRQGALPTSHKPFLNQGKQNLPPSQSVPVILHDYKTAGKAHEEVSVVAKPKTDQASKKKVDTDEALFEFLNSPEPTDRRKSAGSSTRHSRQSSASSVISNKGGRNTTEVPASSSSTSGSSMVHVEMPGSDSRGSPADMDMAELEDAMQDQSPSNSVHSNQELESHNNPMTSSSLDLENRLLKNEIGSLNQEMTSLVQRAKDSETELSRLRDKLSNQTRSVSKSDQVIRELQNKEQDLLEALGAKDSQLAVLRVRLDEADRELEGRQKSVENLQADKQRILRDHTDSSGIHGQALDSLRHKLTEVETALQREQEANKMSKQEAQERQTRLEEEQRSFTEALTAAERRAGDEKGKLTEATNQLKVLRGSLDAAKQELSDYKEKATRILQSKERLISSLRDGSGMSGDSGVSSLEYDTVKQERDMFKEEIQQCRMTIDNLKVELADIESQMQQESDTAQDEISSLEENINEEKRRREDAEQELLKQKREMQYTIEELNKQKTSSQNRINDREAEIDKLRNQLATKSMSSTSESELESRVRELTESLIQKQTMVEALSTEKNSLGLQLERLGQQYKDIQASAVRTNTTVIPVHDDDDDVRQRLPMFLRETHSDHEVTRKMKRAANTIDKFSIRLGVFLRRYPIMRVFVIVYMALLHIWVMIVLLTYQPEIHGAEEHMKLPAPPIP